MFDYHLHSSLSFDSVTQPMDIALAAKAAGLREICFTDHFDYNSDEKKVHNLFSAADYRAAYDGISLPGLEIRQGVELGLTRWNGPQLKELLDQYPFDFAIGSVHFVGGYDPYEPEYWRDRSVREAFRVYLEEIYHCVQIHDDFDVLGHLTYVCKSVHNPTREPVQFMDFQDITDEIMKILVAKGKGMEINTSGVDRAGAFLPSADYLKRFKELGGEIVTVGSDAHDPSRVGQYAPDALAILEDIFGHVCTFRQRKPVFHKLGK